MDNIAYIGIGSNQGNKVENCLRAIESICSYKTNQLLKQSSFYRTEPWGYTEQDDFINAVIKMETSLSPVRLFSILQRVERKLGRKKNGKWGPRIIDLDILFYNHHTFESPQLTIPHPLLHLRAFVLTPLKEIDHHLIHPVLNQTVAQLFDGLNDDKRATKLDEERM